MDLKEKEWETVKMTKEVTLGDDNVLVDLDGQLMWYIYCTDCGKVIDSMQNGRFAEAIGKKHSRDNGHKVIVGYVYYND